MRTRVSPALAAAPVFLFLILSSNCISFLFASSATPHPIYLDLLSMLSGPRLDRSDTGEVSGLTLTGDDKITLYNFLRDVNQARNNKITEKPRASENNQGSESPERLQDPIGEKNKHDHEENSLHDHWGEAEHTHSHQESSAAQAGHEETHEHSHTHTHYHDHNHIRKHSENHQHLAEYFFSGWKR